MRVAVQAIEYPPGSGSYIDISADSDYRGRFIRGVDLSVSATPQAEAVAGGVSLTRSVGLDNRVMLLELSRLSEQVSINEWNSNVRQWFNPANQSAGFQYLKVRLEEQQVDLRIPCYVQRRGPSVAAVDAYDIELYCLVDYFEALTENTATTADGSVEINHAGNDFAPVTITCTGSSVSGDVYVVTDNTGRGLRNHPIALVSATADKTPNQCHVWVNGKPAAFQMGGGGASTQSFVVLVSVPAGGSATAHIAYNTGIVNPLANALNLGPYLPYRSTDNGQMLWWGIVVDGAPQDRNGVWYPARLNLFGADMGSWAFTMTESGSPTPRTTTIAAHYSSGRSGGGGANALVVDLGVEAGTNNALTDLSRITAQHDEDVISYVAYQTANSDRWKIAWSTGADGTVTTAIDLDHAVRLAIGIEPTGVELPEESPRTAAATLQVGPVSNFIDLDFNPNLDPTVTRQTFNFAQLDGMIKNAATGQVITFEDFLYPSGSLVLSTTPLYQQRHLTVPDGPVGGAIRYTDNQDLLRLMPGTNEITETLNSSVTVTHRATYT